jgi:hypothetical protein
VPDRGVIHDASFASPLSVRFLTFPPRPPWYSPSFHALLTGVGQCASEKVGDEPESLADMRGTDARSAQIERPDGVILGFQVSLNKVEPLKAIFRRNLLSKDDARSALRDESVPHRPEMTVVVEALAFTRP